MSSRRWVLAPDPERSLQDEFSRELGLGNVVARILAGRLLPDATLESARRFLRPRLADLDHPDSLPDIAPAVDRLVRAVERKERVVVYGDYDTDGVTACALLVEMLRELRVPAEPYLPDRQDEGYGLSSAFVELAARDRIDLVVTVDCGVSDIETVGRLTTAGVDVIVTDHHVPGEELPNALAVVNPKRVRRDESFPDLTGVGIAFKLAWALAERLSGGAPVTPRLRERLIASLPLVAIGTVADVAPLLSENRVLVSYGLRELARTDHPGLLALLEVSDLQGKAIGPRDVSFRLGPRLNAAGRMRSADLALHLLTERDATVARELAARLDRENTLRQRKCAETYAEARELVAADGEMDGRSVIVVAGKGWHEGVIGIVASRLAEEHHLPAVVIAVGEDGMAKGSARSVPGLHLYRAMLESRERFASFGGHAQAAGFSLAREQIEPFRRELTEACRRSIEERDIVPELEIEGELRFREIGEALVGQLDLLAPFGQGNPRPVFLTGRVKVAGRPAYMGEGNRHFSFFASQDRVAYRAVVFNRTDWFDEMSRGREYWDLAYTLRLNDWSTPPRVELHIVDMRPS